jgi:hypothetical protein
MGHSVKPEYCPFVRSMLPACRDFATLECCLRALAPGSRDFPEGERFRSLRLGFRNEVGETSVGKELEVSRDKLLYR